MSKENYSGAALILIDVQKGIDEHAYWGGNRNNPEAEANIEKLLWYWRSHDYPIFIVQHCSVLPQSPFYPGKEGNELKDIIKLRAQERLIQKSAANAFVGTTLLQDIIARRLKTLVIAGFVTNNSVESTARMAGDMGYSVTVVADATACFDKKGISGKTHPSSLVQEMSLANLKDEYAIIATTEEVTR